MPASILFVCLGNICRSPLAEAAFRREAERVGLDVGLDSAGTAAWHAGKPPDERAIAAAHRNGIDIAHFRARQIAPEDFCQFDRIVALDADVLAELKRLRPPGSRAELSLLLDHVDGREGHGVSDPFYGGEEHFDRTWTDVVAGAKALAREMGAWN
ncbi:low molecular weight protein-tyrosine-phosphatase [Allosphingosinicella sp.]|jgi:protein-tyrosine phosphatase|uniref:low molecular weight protein-tyrosine-phosphatase n=1 Tax=Allosphingosinicella sp. TaxID=2823234 RepID=UPI002F139C40